MADTRDLTFKARHSFERRAKEAGKALARFPDKVPVIVERAPRSTLPENARVKHLVPFDLPVFELQGIIRRRIKLPPEQALFFFVGNSIAASGALIGEVYQREHDADGFLYVTYSGENTFGGASYACR